jgi:putative two-component system response regulator
MSELLGSLYVVKVATNGSKALRIARSASPPDLILLDIMMPDMDGYEVCRQLKDDASTREIPVIFLTAKSEVEDEQRGFDLGAVDYIAKPISPPIVLARVKTHLTLKAAADVLRDKSDFLEKEVARRTREIDELQDITVLTMASLAKLRQRTDSHIRRTQFYVMALAKALIGHPVSAPTSTAKRSTCCSSRAATLEGEILIASAQTRKV